MKRAKLDTKGDIANIEFITKVWQYSYSSAGIPVLIIKYNLKGKDKGAWLGSASVGIWFVFIW